MKGVNAKDTREHLKNLILRAKEGDAPAFEEVYGTYYTPLYHYIRARCSKKEEAEDLTQTVFMKIWNALPTWNTNHTSPLSFFFTVARTTLIDYSRKRSSKEIISDEIVFDHSETESTVTSENTNETKEILRQLIDTLSVEQREVIELYYTDDRTYKEIAEITGKREDAIRQIHSRAIKKLRTLYTPYE